MGKPSKNRINMHDIVGQPLAALADAVDAILKRPELLDEVEVSSIFNECSFIILRAEEAVAARDERAFAALFRLLSEGFAHSPESFQEGIQALTARGALLQSLYSLFHAVVEGGAFAMHSEAVVELVQLVGCLCEDAALKERCGALFMPGLARIIARVHADPDESARHFHVQRGTATALINLVKGSKQNKQRLSSWAAVAEACGSSVDVFFQLQCVELLFRVSRANRETFSEMSSALPADVAERIRTLPNDNTLLARMVAIIEGMSESNDRVLRYHLAQVDAAETKLTDATDVYFTPHFFTVMVTSSNADNITIPYRAIRSVTLGRTGRVVFKLEEFPVKLENLLSRAAGMDTLTLHMAPDRLASFKRSPVREWIMADLQARKAPAATAAAAAADHVSGRKRSAGERDAPSPPGPSSSSTAAAAAERVSETASAIACDAAPHYAVVSPGGAAQDAAATLASLKAVVDEVAAQARSSKDAQALLAQLRYVTEGKLAERRAASAAALNYAMRHFQSRVDAGRVVAQEAREEWRLRAEPLVERAEAAVAEARGGAEERVATLNAGLASVKASNDALNERVACIEVAVQQTLADSRAAEERAVAEMRERFELEIRRQEAALDERLVADTDHSAALAHYISHPAGTTTYL